MALTEGSKLLLHILVKTKTEVVPHMDEKSKQIIEGLKRGSGITAF